MYIGSEAKQLHIHLYVYIYIHVNLIGLNRHDKAGQESMLPCGLACLRTGRYTGIIIVYIISIYSFLGIFPICLPLFRRPWRETF